MYAVIYKNYYMETDNYDTHLASYGSQRKVEYTTIETFKTKEELIDWIKTNNSCSYYNKKDYEVIEYKTLKVTTTVTIDIK